MPLLPTLSTADGVFGQNMHADIGIFTWPLGESEGAPFFLL